MKEELNKISSRDVNLNLIDYLGQLEKIEVH